MAAAIAARRQAKLMDVLPLRLPVGAGGRLYGTVNSLTWPDHYAFPVALRASRPGS